MNRQLSFLILVFALATVVGCGGDKQAYANVTGTVTYNGEPIEKGVIFFSADPGRPPSAIDIIDGKYAGQAQVGSNKITISAKRKSADKAAPKLPPGAETQIKAYKDYMKGKSDPPSGSAGELDLSMVEYIPPEWNSQSTQMRVVESGTKNEFNFEIKGPPKK
jgi:hypothetical protein